MTKDYKALGFKCGLEIHQQIDVGKLFCKCPSVVRDSNSPDVNFHRQLRAVIGETGEVDVAAAFETAKAKTYVYSGCSTSSCEIEYDDEPPQPMNHQALLVALQVAELLHANIVDEIQVMRKTVVDGSNVSGFQRTALVAVDGYIETSRGKVGITTICIEEESAQKLKATSNEVHYRLDRLGVPLVEIATDPDLKDPAHAQEAAEKLGMMLRSTGKAKRGIGSIRQDVNVSIKGGVRTEIKGFQDLKSIPKVIDYEIDRQSKLIKAKKKWAAEVRKAEANFTTTFLRPIPGAARMYPETDVVPVHVNSELLKGLEKVELLTEKIAAVAKTFKIDSELVKKLQRAGKLELFNDISKGCKKLKSSYVADLLLSAEKQVGKTVSADDWKVLFNALEKETLAKENVHAVLKESKPVKDVLSKYELMSDADLEQALKKIISASKGAPFNAVMGQAMGRLRGKASGKKISELLRKLMK